MVDKNSNINDNLVIAGRSFNSRLLVGTGKYADFIVLSKNLLTIKDSDIPSTLIDMTYVGGELKYQR